jgi:chromate transporter
LTSFGGPIAHLGYFRDEFVVRRRWLEENTFADLVALSQFLPGPASSKVGIAVGLSRAGYCGAIAAWAGFTLPSALALVLFGFGAAAIGDKLGSGWLHGLKVAAVAVVAQAVLGMMRSLAPDRERATLAILATIIVLAFPSAGGPRGCGISAAVHVADATLAGRHPLCHRRHRARDSSSSLTMIIPSPRMAEGFFALVLLMVVGDKTAKALGLTVPQRLLV